jgi:DNA-binding NarL/FixJ family response regulator
VHGDLLCCGGATPVAVGSFQHIQGTYDEIAFFGLREVFVVRVLVVDDFEPFRAAICSILSDNPDLLVVAEASDGLEAVWKGEDPQPDLIVLDLGIPTLNWFEAARRICTVSPRSKIIIASLGCSPEFAWGALRSGAAGYVIKADIFNQLPPAIEAVLQGKRWFA